MFPHFVPQVSSLQPQLGEIARDRIARTVLYGRELGLGATVSIMSKTRFIADLEIHKEVIIEAISSCQDFLWIATADIKDMHIARGRSAIPFLQRLSELVDDGVSVRLIHAKEPGPAFRSDYDRFPNLINGMEMILCPRAHFKSVIVDGKTAYTGSANLTGAGLGAKSKNRRNFEGGILTDDPELVRPIMAQFDRLWIGEHCPSCQRKAHCVTYHELIES